MEITRKYWDKHIQPRLNEPPNLLLESELIEFGTKALDIIDACHLQQQSKQSGRIKMRKWVPAWVLKLLRKRNFRLRDAGKLPDGWHWADLELMSRGHWA